MANTKTRGATTAGCKNSQKAQGEDSVECDLCGPQHHARNNVMTLVTHERATRNLIPTDTASITKELNLQVSHPDPPAERGNPRCIADIVSSPCPRYGNPPTGSCLWSQVLRKSFRVRVKGGKAVLRQGQSGQNGVRFYTGASDILLSKLSNFSSVSWTLLP